MILAIGGIFIVTTIMLSTSSKKIYEKTKSFSSPKEIIDIIGNTTLGAFDSNKEYVNTSELNECLSKRKRVTYSQLDYAKLDVKELPENNTVEIKNQIISDYKSKINHLEGLSVPDKVDAVRLVGRGIPIYMMNHTDLAEEEKYNNNLRLDIVFIDEGEGWVIDYFWFTEITEEGANVLYTQQ